MDEIRSLVRSHYVDPSVTAKRIADLGAPKTARILREHLPTTKTARSGDLGEVLATEIAEHTLNFNVPIRRLRWKDGRNMALRGDDIIGIRCDAKGKVEFLKGESKSRTALTTGVLDEAGAALDRDRGRPTRHSVIFVAERLRELGNDLLATRLEEAVLDSFSGRPVEHFLLALTGGNPKSLLTAHLTACAKNEEAAPRSRRADRRPCSVHRLLVRRAVGGRIHRRPDVAAAGGSGSWSEGASARQGLGARPDLARRHASRGCPPIRREPF